jgi:hypothetical protein
VRLSISLEARLGALLLVIAVAFNAFFLAPELRIGCLAPEWPPCSSPRRRALVTSDATGSVTGRPSGAAAAVEPVAERGSMSFVRPAGEHRVTLDLEAAPVRRFALVVSLVMAILAIGSIGSGSLRRSHGSNCISSAVTPRTLPKALAGNAGAGSRA